MTTMAYEKAAGILIVVHTQDAPSDAEWARWIERMGRRDFNSVLVVTKGGGPTGPQRAKGTEFWKTQPSVVPFSVITDVAFVRGILTALNWLGFSDIKAFSSSDIASALNHLQISRANQPLVLNMVMILQRDLNNKHIHESHQAL